MKKEFLGDSYDVVKQSLLRCLQPCGKWKAHPMFTEEVKPNEAKAFARAFSRLIGVPLVSREKLDSRTDRKKYFAAARNCKCHLFLDPDTGLYIEKRRCSKATHLSLPELVDIASDRQNLLTLVFDQSFSRGQKRQQQLKGKLHALAKRGLHGIAYHSHACFILVGRDAKLVKHARDVLLKKSRLPPGRLLQRPRRAERKAGRAVACQTRPGRKNTVVSTPRP
jgi:hypothetical protein